MISKGRWSLGFYALAATLLQAHPDHGTTVAAKAERSEVTDGQVIGHNGLRYRVNRHWSKADPKTAPVTNAHAMVEDNEGRIFVVTDDMANDFLVYEKDGSFVRSIENKELAGGHGLDLITIDGVEYLIHVDAGWHQTEQGAWKFKNGNGAVTLVGKDGTIFRRLPSPHDLGKFTKDEAFKPCDVAVTPENEILVVDGYATNRVLRYKPDGSLVGLWGGTKPGDPATLVNAHGISIDASDPENPLVWVSSREENKLKAFTVEGEFKGEVELPGAYAGQAFFAGGRIYTGVCWSKENGTGKRLENSGFLLVLDRKSRKVISAPGGTEPKYIDGVLQPLHQQVPVFKHVHDLYVDSEGDIYVGEWNSGNRYPYKLELIRDES